ncbi:phosphorylase [Halococcus sp. AFM35]|uniref:phosphorylase n=1 Tax=Halococcus sp. AFM35 TaxID=3421653 RepID=UPI003EBDBA4E
MAGKRNRLIRRNFLKAAGTAIGGGVLAGFEAEKVAANKGGPSTESPFSPKVVVLPAFEVGDIKGDTAGEFQLWYKNYDLDKKLEIPGTNAPLYYNENGLAVTPTGIGKSAATTTVTSVLSSPKLKLDNTLFITAGIAGTPPDVGTLGSVFISNAVVDWDLMHRWSRKDGPADPYAAMKLDPSSEKYYKLNDGLASIAYYIGQQANLTDSKRAKQYREFYKEETANREPFVGMGTTICGDEYWHGSTFSNQASWMCSELYDVGRYATTEQEDYGTATALARYGYLDQYLSIRSVSNFDQPHPGQTINESLNEADSGGFGPSVQNVFRVSSEIVDIVL